jgi:hypothetical protein
MSFSADFLRKFVAWSSEFTKSESSSNKTTDHGLNQCYHILWPTFSDRMPAEGWTGKWFSSNRDFPQGGLKAYCVLLMMETHFQTLRQNYCVIQMLEFLMDAVQRFHVDIPETQGTSDICWCTLVSSCDC